MILGGPICLSPFSQSSRFSSDTEAAAMHLPQAAINDSEHRVNALARLCEVYYLTIS